MYELEKTKQGITVRVVQSSKNHSGQKVITFECEYPRFILAEINTHRTLSRNSMSSRAVPVAKMIDQVRNEPAKPVHWGANQAGMQAEKECSNLIDLGAPVKFTGEEAWGFVANSVSDYAERMSEAGYHKQIVNRILEPFQRMKTVITSTEWDNFFELRCHKDAQPEFKVLADLMRECYEEAEFMQLKGFEWHVPYVTRKRNANTGELNYYINEAEEIDVEQALKVSASCCAQVSYRLLDNSLEKALNIFDRLIESKPVHASPVEHQLKPISASNSSKTQNDPAKPSTWQRGVTHVDRSGTLWSANSKGWIQFRHLL